MLMSDVTPKASVRANIIHRANELFFQFGASRVTMEEVAKRLGISKKTLYKYFANKDELLEAVMEQAHSTILSMTQSLVASAFEANDEEFLLRLSALGEMMSTIISTTSSSPLLSDIQQSFPLIWQRVEERRLQAMTDSLRAILQHGVKRNVFRADMNYDVVVHIYLAALESIGSPHRLAALSLSAGDAHTAIIRTLFEGVFTESGRAIAALLPFGKR
jgi:AcrR family transcriptional regulator